MCFSWPLPTRVSPRLDLHDYSSAGVYFVTFCTYERRPTFGRIVNGTVQLNRFGTILEEEWIRTGSLRPNVIVDDSIVMPNHFHGIVAITSPTLRATRRVAPTRSSLSRDSLGSIIGQIKATTARRINALRGTPGVPVWQRNYYDRVVRNDRELDAIRKYIAENPLQWSVDRFYRS